MLPPFCLPPGRGYSGSAWLCCCLCGLLLCTMLVSSASASSLYGRLRAGDCFFAQLEQGNLRYEARLRLFARNFFELTESFTWKKQPPLRRTFSGLWFQLQGGSLLWLHNRYGLSRPLNLGGEQALYADMPLPGERGILPVIFKPVADVGDSLRLMGVIRTRDNSFVFRESASSLEFPLADPLPETMRNAVLPLFCELDARFVDRKLVIEKVCAASPRLPSDTEAVPRELSEILAGGMWLLELSDGQQLSASFIPKPAFLTESSADMPVIGQLDLAGQGVYLSLPLSAQGHAVKISLDSDGRKMLHSLGLTALSEVLDAVCRWDMHGALLVLYDMNSPRCTLLRRAGRGLR